MFSMQNNWFLLVGNMQETMQNRHLLITLHILEIITILTFCLMYYVKKVIHPPRLDSERHMIISELNMLLLAKCKMYTFLLMVSLSQILTLSLNWLQLIDSYVFVYICFVCTCLYFMCNVCICIAYHFVYDQKQ